MRIQCPDCAAAYEVPEAMLVPGRPVRCARCGQRWQPLATGRPAPAATAPDDPGPAPSADIAGSAPVEAAEEGESAPLPAVPAGSRRRHPLRPRPRLAPAPEADPDRVLMAEPARALLSPPEGTAMMLPAPLPPAAPRAGLVAPLLAWLASLLLVGGALAALWLWREEAMAAWPPLARLFQALGVN